MRNYKPVVLIILDGLGIAQDKIGSPWELAEHPTFLEMEKFYPFTALQASGIAVGLPWGKEGNSEVGHLTIGAGRIIYNYLPKITNSIDDGSFFKNEILLKTAQHTKENNSNLHLIGLFSSGTVHSYHEHLYALLEFAKNNNIKNVFLHLFTDGKDAYNKEGSDFFKNLEIKLQKNFPSIKIASVIGRKYAMDRDGNWDRIEKAYNLFTQGAENKFQSASEYINDQYNKSTTDESIEPGTLGNENYLIKNNDAVIFYNFREDSARELTHSFIDENFNNFKRKKLENLFFVTMTEYDKNFNILSAFKSANISNPLAKVISDAGLKQLHIAETEKYAHITYFLNGGTEKTFEKEDRILIESVSSSSYDETPKMSTEKITETLIANLKNYDFFAVNFANADMVGHTGNISATAKALEVIDISLGKIIKEVISLNGALIITADHGNAEEKLYKLTGKKRTKHSTNPVPFYLITKENKKNSPSSDYEIEKKYKDISGTLTDITPTILELLNLEKSPEMTGNSLIKNLI